MTLNLRKKNFIINTKTVFFSFFFSNICNVEKQKKSLKTTILVLLMQQSAETSWNNCLAFIKDNIQPQAYKTWFEPIIPLKLSENALSIQVPSKFFYEWLEEHYVKLLKIVLTKELGESARLVYVIKMENTYGNKQPFTESIPSSQQAAVKSQQVDAPLSSMSTQLRNPFVIPGIRNLQIESQLNPNYNFQNFLREIPTV